MMRLARAVTFLFHPLIVPTAGFFIFLNAGFYFSMVPMEVKRFILLVVFFSTALLPLVSLTVLGFSSRFDFSFEKTTDRVVMLLATAVFYYLGYFLLGKLQITPFFRVFMVSGALLIVLLSLISMKWKISLHLSALGATLGAIMALSFRLGTNPAGWIICLIFASGLVGTALLFIGKQTLIQQIAGFLLGLILFYLIFYFI